MLFLPLALLSVSSSFESGDDAARFSIVSVPTGATVYLDLDSIGVTPLPKYPIPAGIHIISVKKPGYVQLDTLIYASNGELALRMVLPGGAEINQAFEQSEELAVPLYTEPSPVSIQRPPTPTPSVPSPPPITQSTGERPASLLANGSLMAVSEPNGAVLVVNNAIRGETPAVLNNLRPGAYSIELRKEGYEPYTQTISIKAGGIIRIVGKLNPTSGTVVIDVRPGGAIYINGALRVKETDRPFTTELPLGVHQIRVTNPTLGNWEQQVEVTGGAAQRILVDFRPKRDESVAVRTPPNQLREAARPQGRMVDPDSTYTFADQPPQLKGGFARLNSMASYPEQAARRGVEGKVFLQFIVNEKGRVEQARVSRGIGSGCDEEALRAIRRAQFEPGTINGQPIRVWHALAIEFRLKPR